MNKTREWKNRVDEAFAELCEVLDSDRYLDHEIRAVEWLLTQKGKYGRPYTIIRKPTDASSGRKGSALLFDYGAQIWYSSEGSRLEKMIAIGHELGHIYLHHLNLDGDRHSDTVSKDMLLETQATYFSKMIIKRRSELFKDKKYIDARKIDNWRIDEEIKGFQPDYDELMNDTTKN